MGLPQERKCVMNKISMIKPVARDIMLATAVVAGSLTALSVFRTPGQKLVPGNPNKVRVIDDCFVSERDAFPYAWDEKASIADNVVYNVCYPSFDRARLTFQQYVDKIIDPLSKSPILPAATLLVSAVGAKALKPKDEMSDEAKENDSVQENNIDIYS